ncbi:hypothetical protein PIB30_087266, partial [Stylosanthes scabra]|nr:hypothetical protein [Stylosanthes scabra]
MVLLGEVTHQPPTLSFSSSIFFTNLKISKLPSQSKPLTFPPKPFSHSCALSLFVACKAATLPVLSFSGDKIGEAQLDLCAAPLDTTRAVVYRAIITDLQNKRRGTATTR